MAWWDAAPTQTSAPWAWRPPAESSKPAARKAAPKRERAPKRDSNPSQAQRQGASSGQKYQAPRSWQSRLLQENKKDQYIEPDWTKLKKPKPIDYMGKSSKDQQFIEPDWTQTEGYKKRMAEKKKSHKVSFGNVVGPDKTETWEQHEAAMQAVRKNRVGGPGKQPFESQIGKPVPERPALKKAPEFQEVKGKRKLTWKEYKALPKSQKNLVRFTTEIEANRRGAGGGDDKLREIYADLDINRGAGGSPEVRVPFIDFDQFKKGMASITEDDLFGKGNDTIPAKKRKKGAPAPQTPYFQRGFTTAGQPGAGVRLPKAEQPRIRKGTDLYWEDPEKARQEQYDKYYGGQRRELVLAQISAAVDKRFEWLDSPQGKAEAAAAIAAEAKAAAAAKAKANPAANAQAPQAPTGAQAPGTPAAGGAVEVVPAGLTDSLGITPEKQTILNDLMARMARPSLVQSGVASPQNLAGALQESGITPEQFAMYAGTVGENIEKSKQAISGDPNDTMPFNEFAKLVGLERQKG